MILSSQVSRTRISVTLTNISSTSSLQCAILQPPSLPPQLHHDPILLRFIVPWIVCATGNNEVKPELVHVIPFPNNTENCNESP